MSVVNNKNMEELWVLLKSYIDDYLVSKNSLPTKMTPTSHASTSATYGAGNSSYYGHVKLSDSISSTSGASGGIAATPAAVKSAKEMAEKTSIQYITFSGTGNPFTQSIKFDFTPTIIKMYKATTNSTDVKSLVSVHKVNPGTGAGITMIWGQGGGTFNSSNNTFSWSGGAGYYLVEAIK